MVSGTLASICAIRIATTSSLDVQPSMPPIVAAMPGTEWVAMVTITFTAATIVVHTEGISACTTAIAVVTSVAIVTAPPVSLEATEEIVA